MINQVVVVHVRLHSLTSLNMLDFHWASPATHTPYELCINGGILGEDDAIFLYKP